MATSTQYVALLRGINVGGNNLIKMADLKAVFEKAGFTDVRTYIASGNVLFRSSEKDVEKLTKQIERLLSKRFNYQSVVVVISERDFRNVVAKVPKGFGAQPQKYHSDVIFLKPPLTSAKAMKEIKTRPEVDEAAAGPGVLYFSRLSSQRTKSKLGQIVGTPVYQSMTIRSWGTTKKLLDLLEVD